MATLAFHRSSLSYLLAFTTTFEYLFLLSLALTPFIIEDVRGELDTAIGANSPYSKSLMFHSHNVESP